MSNMVTTLNPNAAEFVPSSLRSTYGNKRASESSNGDSVGTSGTAIFGRSESSVSNHSDDEAHQYWRHQLPDDITPDFNIVGEDHVPSWEQLSLEGLSIHGGMETSRVSASGSSELFGTRQGKSPLGVNSINMKGNLGYLGPTTSSWDKQFVMRDQQHTTVTNGNHYNGDLSDGFVNNMVEDVPIEAVECLALQFPGYSAEILADMYFANGCDLNYTIKMLSQLEQLQGDGGFSQNLNLESSAVPSIPSLSRLGLQLLPLPDGRHGQSKFARDLLQDSDRYKYTSNVRRGATDYASVVRKAAPKDNIHWKHVRNNSVDSSIGSRSSQLLASSNYSGHGKMLYEDKTPSLVASQTALGLLETGVENAYFDSREEARDLELLRNAYLEQASEAYLAGNKALARELSGKGNFYNMQMKAAQQNSGDASYRKRDPVPYQGYKREVKDRLINLHGLHVSEALHTLKHELDVLRSTALSSRQQLQATIFLGPGQLSNGMRTPPRLPMAVEQLLMEEGLPYTPSQPGLLHVVIY